MQLRAPAMPRRSRTRVPGVGGGAAGAGIAPQRREGSQSFPQNPVARVRAYRSCLKLPCRHDARHADTARRKLPDYAGRRPSRCEDVWRRRRYDTKQLEVFAVEEDGRWVVVTVSAATSEAAMRLTYDP